MFVFCFQQNANVITVTPRNQSKFETERKHELEIHHTSHEGTILNDSTLITLSVE